MSSKNLYLYSIISYNNIAHDVMTLQHTSVAGEQTVSSSHELSLTGETTEILIPESSTN